MDEFLTRFDFQDVTWEKHVLSGDPAHEIVQWARSTHAYLIVMGSGGRTGLPYLFMGSTAIKVARQLPCALLTVKRVQVLVPDASQKIADINTAFEEGQALLAEGFCQEAIASLTNVSASILAVPMRLRQRPMRSSDSVARNRPTNAASWQRRFGESCGSNG